MWLIGLRSALHALRRNRLRSALATLGILIGVAALVMIDAAIGGGRARVDEQIRDLGANLLVVNAGSLVSRGVRLGAGTRAVLTEDDAAALAREVPSARAVAPVLGDTGQVIQGSRNWSTRYYGSTPEILDALEFRIASGRMYAQAEVDVAAKVVVIGETVARNLFGQDDPVGRVMRVRRVPMEVVGVLAPKGPNSAGVDRDDIVLVPISALRNRVIGGGLTKVRLVSYVWVKLYDGSDLEEARSDVRTILRERHRLTPEREDDFTIRDMSEVIGLREESSAALSLLLAAVAAITLLAGGVGITNIMLASVTQRTREIGMRMAVGARKRDIVTQFLCEAVALAMIGGSCGALIGIAGSYVIAYYASWPATWDVAGLLLALGCAVLVGLCSGLYPALKAARMPPVQALRYE